MSYWWRQPISWFSTSVSGLSGGVLALASPVLGAVWAVLTLFRLRFERRHLALAAAISLAVVTPWLVRCRIVMDRWIPIKSNSAYELWQAHVLDADGIVDVGLFRTHPYNGSSVDGQSYDNCGEVGLLDEKRAKWREWLANQPIEYGSRVLNRISAAFVQPVLLDPAHYQRTLALAANDVWVMICSLTLLVMLRQAPQESAIPLRLAIAIWLLTLFPYMLVSYYQRYDIPVFPMRLFVVLFVFRWFGNSPVASSDVKQKQKADNNEIDRIAI
jgi:hypothetical protein